MGRVKEQILKKEEQDWVQEQQNEIVQNMNESSTYIYSDLIDLDALEDKKLKYLEYKLKSEDIERKIYPENIEEINGLVIRYKVRQYGYARDEVVKIRTVPLLNILYIDYVYDK